MSSAATASSNFQSILDDALSDYVKQTGVDLATHPFAQSLRGCDTADAIINLLQDKANEFQAYREGNRRLINRLKPLVLVLHTVTSVLDGAATLAPFQPTRAILIGIDVLLTASVGVSASYDILVELFECVGNFLDRLQIYTEIALHPSMCGMITKIMVEVLAVLSLATQLIEQGRLKMFSKKLSGNSEIEDALRRLDRLVLDEVCMAGAVALQRLDRLERNLDLFMGDAQRLLCSLIQPTPQIDGTEPMRNISQTHARIQEVTSEIDDIKQQDPPPLPPIEQPRPSPQRAWFTLRRPRFRPQQPPILHPPPQQPPIQQPLLRQPLPEQPLPQQPRTRNSSRPFDRTGFCDRMHEFGRAYRFQANELIKICRSFTAASDQSIDQDTELSSVLATCDEAIKRAVGSRTKRACPELDEQFELAIQDLKQYDATFHRRRTNINDMVTRARKDDERNSDKPRDKSRDNTMIEVEFHILPTLPSDDPTVVRQALSGSSGDSVQNEILWNFSHYKGAEHLSLAQNPRFYVGLPTSADGYHATFSCRPTERYEGTIYVLTNNSHHIFFEFGSLRAFDNVWNTNDVLIFRDVVGRLEGEAAVEGSIRASPPFTYRSEPSSRHQLEEYGSWGDILRRMRGRLRESSLSRVQIGIKSA